MAFTQGQTVKDNSGITDGPLSDAPSNQLYVKAVHDSQYELCKCQGSCDDDCGSYMIEKSEAESFMTVVP